MKKYTWYYIFFVRILRLIKKIMYYTMWTLNISEIENICNRRRLCPIKWYKWTVIWWKLVIRNFFECAEISLFVDTNLVISLLWINPIYLWKSNKTMFDIALWFGHCDETCSPNFCINVHNYNYPSVQSAKIKGFISSVIKLCFANESTFVKIQYWHDEKLLKRLEFSNG